LEFRVQRLEFRAYLEFRVWSLEFRVYSLEFRAWSLEFSV